LGEAVAEQPLDNVGRPELVPQVGCELLRSQAERGQAGPRHETMPQRPIRREKAKFGFRVTGAIDGSLTIPESASRRPLAMSLDCEARTLEFCAVMVRLLAKLQ
jgi:hypothetical protein